jgi:hypothetical protein
MVLDMGDHRQCCNDRGVGINDNGSKRRQGNGTAREGRAAKSPATTHSHTHSHTHTLTHSHTHTLTHSHTHTLTHSHTHTLTHSHTRTLAHSHTRTLAHLATGLDQGARPVLRGTGVLGCCDGHNHIQFVARLTTQCLPTGSSTLQGPGAGGNPNQDTSVCVAGRFPLACETRLDQPLHSPCASPGVSAGTPW